MRVLLPLAPVAPVALGIAAACLVLLRQADFGPGLSADSAIYVSTARNLFAGAGFVPAFGEYSHRPPLYPLVLAATGFFHDDMIDAAAVLNAVAFGLSVFLVAAWLRRRQVSAPLAAWAGLALALSPVAGVAAYVWSESLFVLFVLAALFSLHRFLHAGTRQALLVAAGFAALCCLTRYAGASVLICATVLIAARRQWRPETRFRAVALYAVVVAAPTALWLGRNLLVVDSLTGDRSQLSHFPALPTFLMLVEMMLGTMVGPTVLGWIERLWAHLGVAAGAPAIARAGTQLVCLLAVWGLAALALARWRRAAPGAAVLAGFVVCYLGLLAAVASAGAGLGAEQRYATPLVAPMLAACALALHACASPAGANWLGRGARWRRWIVAAAMTAALSLWLAQWVAPNVRDVKQWRVHGGGYAARRWAESATLASLRSGPRDGLLLSNDPFAVYLSTGGGTAKHRSGNDRIGRLPDKIPSETDVAWFYAPRVPRAANLMTFLSAFPKMRVMATHADGIIFRQGEQDDADDAVARLAEALLRQGRQGAMLAESHFNVYWTGADRRLTYVRRDCAATDVRQPFFLHVTPEDSANRTWALADFWQPVSVDFHNLDFLFAPRGIRHGDVCIATHALPRYAIAEVRTGQWAPEPRGEIWSVRFTLPLNSSASGRNIRTDADANHQEDTPALP